MVIKTRGQDRPHFHYTTPLLQDLEAKFPLRMNVRWLLFSLYSNQLTDDIKTHDYIAFISKMSQNFKKSKNQREDSDIKDQEEFTNFIFQQVEHQLLLKKAEFLLEHARGTFYKSTYGILKTAYKNATEKGDFSDLIEFIPKLEVKFEIKKKEIEQLNKERKEKLLWKVNHLYGDLSKEQLLKLKKKNDREIESCHKLWTEKRRPDERTMWKANLFNKIEALAETSRLLDQAIELLEIKHVETESQFKTLDHFLNPIKPN